MTDKDFSANHVPVVIIIPPFQSPFVPSLATGLLKGALVKRGIGCKIIYANMITFDVLGMEAFRVIASYSQKEMVSDRLFAHYAADGMPHIGEVLDSRHDCLRIFEDAVEPRKEISRAEWLEIETRCGEALIETAKQVARLSPKIVAFSNSYSDVLATIAFARSIRKALRDALFLLGGSGCPNEIGEEMMRAGGVFNFLFRGEADLAFPDFCEDYLTGGVLPPEQIIECGIVREMDSVPIPDYRDFIELQKNKSYPVATLSFESSRGCSWGARKPCNFCADACYDYIFRNKSPKRMMEELTQLRLEHPDCNLFAASDLMIPPVYFDGFFHWLASSGLRLNFAYQTKTNLGKRQLTILKEAGCSYCLAGIESLSSGILKLLNKGTTPSANLILLRNARELDVNTIWIMIVGIPGDRKSHYEEQLAIMPALHHLHPPNIIPLILMRFSAYTRHPERFGIRNLRPLSDYTRIYPPHFDVNRLAYFFEGEFPSESLEHPEILMSVSEGMIRWFGMWRSGKPPVLRVIRMPDGSRLVEDSRDCARQHNLPLDEEQYALLCHCRVPRKKETISHESAVGMFLDNNMLVEINGKLLSVVCDEEGE